MYMHNAGKWYILRGYLYNNIAVEFCDRNMCDALISECVCVRVLFRFQKIQNSLTFQKFINTTVDASTGTF